MGKKGREKIRVLLVLIFGEKIIKVGGAPAPPNPPGAPAYRPVIGSIIKGEKIIKGNPDREPF